MNENVIELSAYVEGQQISWRLNPAPKTLYDEILEFAGQFANCARYSFVMRLYLIKEKIIQSVL